MEEKTAGVGPGCNEGLGPQQPECKAFEAWFLERYSYSRAVLTNPIWAREIADAAEAFQAGQATERELAVRVLADVLEMSCAFKMHDTREEDARALLRLARERA